MLVRLAMPARTGDGALPEALPEALADALEPKECVGVVCRLAGVSPALWSDALAAVTLATSVALASRSGSEAATPSSRAGGAAPVATTIASASATKRIRCLNG